MLWNFSADCHTLELCFVLFLNTNNPDPNTGSVLSGYSVVTLASSFSLLRAQLLFTSPETEPRKTA